MLKEYLLEHSSRQAVWSCHMPGVQICRFALPDYPQSGARDIPVRGSSLHFETIVCLRGRLTIRPRSGEPYPVEAPGIFLLSDIAGLSSCLYSGNLCGILIAVDAKAAKESLMAVCSTLGMKLDTRIVKEKMAAKNGCMVLPSTPWTRAFFEAMQCLPEETQARYCVFKAVELLYLLCTERSVPSGSPLSSGRPVSPRLAEIRAYIQAHLSEKLTIEFLCKQFSVSPTYLKEGFRRAYGITIHSFLIQQRLQQARELVCTTRIPIQQIAQAVGYEGMSRFNAAFKQYYGIPPGQYRKMSETATPRLF